MRGRTGNRQPQLPTLLPWMRTLIGSLFALYVLELVLRNAGVQVYALAWQPFEAGFAIWQPVTRFLVQGASSNAVFHVLIGLIVLYFLLPALDRAMPRSSIIHATGWAAVGGTILPLLLDALWIDHGVVMGWTVLITSGFVLFGLSTPNAVVLLFFVLPVSGNMIVWGTLGVATLLFLVDPTMGSAEAIGTWAGVMGWWNVLGPGGRRRLLLRKARHIEAQLERFQVLEGGKGNPQEDQDDQWIH